MDFDPLTTILQSLAIFTIAFIAALGWNVSSALFRLLVGV